MTNHKKLIDVTASLKRNYFRKEKVYSKYISLKKCRDIGLVWELHAPTDRLLVGEIQIAAVKR